MGTSNKNKAAAQVMAAAPKGACEMRREVEICARPLAYVMERIHGGVFEVKIDHANAFVMVFLRPRADREPIARASLREAV